MKKLCGKVAGDTMDIVWLDAILIFYGSSAGQSDIKKLRRENYQLRKEIWTLRDEHDRLGKLLRRNCDAGGSSGSAGAGNLEADEKIAIDDDADVYGYEYDEEYRCCSCHSNEVLNKIHTDESIR